MISRFAFCKLVGSNKPIVENARTFVAAGTIKLYSLETHHKNYDKVVIVVNNCLSFTTFIVGSHFFRLNEDSKHSSTPSILPSNMEEVDNSQKSATLIDR